jgi:hypothetical protein
MTKKSGLEGGGAGDSKKKGLSILFLGQSTHRQKADILSFPSRGRPPPTFYPITVFSSLGATKKIRVLQGTVVLHMQYPARVTNNWGRKPRSNSNVLRFVQHSKSCLTKCDDTQYRNLKVYIQVIAFAYKTAFNSAINCTPFEARPGLRARPII